MGYSMSKEIIYWLGDYNPEKEAIAKEVKLLHNHFSSSFLFSMTPYKEFKIGKRMIKFYRKLHPLRPFISLVEKQFRISHIFSWGGESYYLNRLKYGPKLLTVSGGLPKDISPETINKADIIVVECELDRQRLIEHGLEPGKIRLIYPGIAPVPARTRASSAQFTILFASAPLFPKMLAARGLYLLLQVAERLKEVSFLILWRKKETEFIDKIINKNKHANVCVINRIVKNMSEIYDKADAVIAPFTTS